MTIVVQRISAVQPTLQRICHHISKSCSCSVVAPVIVVVRRIRARVRHVQLNLSVRDVDAHATVASELEIICAVLRVSQESRSERMCGRATAISETVFQRESRRGIKVARRPTVFFDVFPTLVIWRVLKRCKHIQHTKMTRSRRTYLTQIIDNVGTKQRREKGVHSYLFMLTLNNRQRKTARAQYIFY